MNQSEVNLDNVTDIIKPCITFQAHKYVVVLVPLLLVKEVKQRRQKTGKDQRTTFPT